MLTQICRRFIEDFRRFHSGIPDLTVWNLEIKTWKVGDLFSYSF